MNKHKKDLLNRMHYARGHFDSVIKMIEDDKYCIDIIHQSQAVCAAVEKVNKLILKNHLNTCVSDAIKSDDINERKKKIEELIEIYNKRGER